MSATVNQIPRSMSMPSLMQHRQCYANASTTVYYDFMGKMIQWRNIDGELDHIQKMLGLIDGRTISFADRPIGIGRGGLNHVLI